MTGRQVNMQLIRLHLVTMSPCHLVIPKMPNLTEFFVVAIIPPAVQTCPGATGFARSAGVERNRLTQRRNGRWPGKRNKEGSARCHQNWLPPFERTATMASPDEYPILHRKRIAKPTRQR